MTLKNLLLPVGLGCCFVGAVAALGTSCGDSKPSGGTGGAATTGGAGGGSATGGAGGAVASSIVIQGVASPFPNDPESDFTSLALAIADPLLTLQGKPALAMLAPFDTSGATGCPGDSCVAPFSFPSVTVDPAMSSLGLIAIMQDLRPMAGAPAKWVRTGTGIANSAQLAAAVAGGSLSNRPVYAISTKLEASLSKFAATASSGAGGLTGAPGELASKGFAIAFILANGTPKPTPVEGATIAPPSSANGKFAILYPTADFTSVGAATSASGLAIIFPIGPAATAPVTPWSVTPPAGSTATWPAQVVGVQADGAVVLLDVSN